jgi:hypothetical protein
MRFLRGGAWANNTIIRPGQEGEFITHKQLKTSLCIFLLFRGADTLLNQVGARTGWHFPYSVRT